MRFFSLHILILHETRDMNAFSIISQHRDCAHSVNSRLAWWSQEFLLEITISEVYTYCEFKCNTVELKHAVMKWAHYKSNALIGNLNGIGMDLHIAINSYLNAVKLRVPRFVLLFVHVMIQLRWSHTVGGTNSSNFLIETYPIVCNCNKT